MGKYISEKNKKKSFASCHLGYFDGCCFYIYKREKGQ